MFEDIFDEQDFIKIINNVGVLIINEDDNRNSLFSTYQLDQYLSEEFGQEVENFINKLFKERNTKIGKYILRTTHSDILLRHNTLITELFIDAVPLHCQNLSSFKLNKLVISKPWFYFKKIEEMKWENTDFEILWYVNDRIDLKIENSVKDKSKFYEINFRCSSFILKFVKVIIFDEIIFNCWIK